MADKNITVADEYNLRPKEKALYNCVLKLLKSGKNFRACGSSHSKLFYSLIFYSDNMIDMRKFVESPVLEHNNILTVSPGMNLSDVRKFLARYDLKLYGTPESKFISIGGAILFCSHHSTGYWDAISNYVIDMLIIDGTGKIQLLTDPQLFVNYGLLGIVLRIRIKVFPATNIYWKHTLLDNIDKVKIEKSTYCLFFGPYSDRILKTDIYLTDQKECRSWKRLIWDLALGSLYICLIAKLETLFSNWIPALGIFAAELFTYEPDAIRNKFDYFEPVPSTTAFTLEYALDQANLIEAYKSILQIIKKYRQKSTYVLRFWCRFQDSTDYINDLAFGRQTVLFEVTLREKQKHARLLVDDITQVFLKLDGRPHLGKTLLEPSWLKNYNFTLLKQAIKKYDPYKKFQNKFTKAVF